MPDTSGKLTPEELAKIREWFAKHWKPHPCPVCLGTAWLVDQSMARMDTAAGPFGPTNIPLVLVACDTCGYVAPFSAVKIGLVPAATPPANQPSAASPATTTPPVSPEPTAGGSSGG